MLYMLVWANERAAPESIRALNLFPAFIVTVGQSDTSPRANGCLKIALPFHLYHYWERALVVQRIRVTLWIEGESWMMTILEWWGLLGVWRSWMWLFLTVSPVQCSGSCWNETGSTPWNSGMSDVCRRGSKCGIGCNYASWMCHSRSSNRGIHWPKTCMSCCGGCMRSMMCAFWNFCCCHGENGSITVTCWNVSHVWDHNRWIVICPFGCGYIDAFNKICLGGMVFLMEESCWGSPLQSGQIHSCNTVYWGSGCQNDSFVLKQNIYHHWTSYWSWRVSAWLLLVVLHRVFQPISWLKPKFGGPFHPS